MKIIFPFILLSLLFTFFSCSSTVTEDVSKKEVRKFQLDYVLQDAKDQEVPSWINDPQGWAKEFDSKDARKFRYFVSTT